MRRQIPNEVIFFCQHVHLFRTFANSCPTVLFFYIGSSIVQIYVGDPVSEHSLIFTPRPSQLAFALYSKKQPTGVAPGVELDGAFPSVNLESNS